MERHRSNEFEFLITCAAHGNTLKRIGLWMRKFGLDGILDTLRYLEPWLKEKTELHKKEQAEQEERMRRATDDKK